MPQHRDKAYVPMTEEKKKALQKINKQKKEQESIRKVKNARIWLFVIAGINILVGCFSYFTAYQNVENLYVLIEALVIAGLFIGLGLWAKTKPYSAFLTAIILYSVLVVLGAVVEPTSVFKGIIIKVLVYVALFKGLKEAKNIKKITSDNLIDNINFDDI